MMLILIRGFLAALLSQQKFFPMLEELAMWLFQEILSKNLKRPLSEEEKAALKAGYEKSISEGNSLHYEQALNPLRKYPPQ